ncbi:nucleotidyltransferase family protein [Roseomonas sp. E05]|uniref:nucleotidyltransferase family protein n=1 Tax=Roseomonas sp. E05 TaxID=3046310 RepID=UPI0024B889D6|nr:nucleotidyltransferase family protein [Roseomonas sp. E05]MDJ0390823.1 nucleotidyltransferase family protein [Roseomonas sp. E05]
MGARLDRAALARLWPPLAVNAAWMARLLAETPALHAPLAALARLDLPDAWIGAGFVRNAVWDALHGRPPGLRPGADLDVVFFAPQEAVPETAVEAALHAALPGLAWSARNQARMHRRNGDAPYADTADALRHWPETATAIAARCGPAGIEFLAPLGLEDLFGLVVRPGPAFAGRPEKLRLVAERIVQRGWCARWPKLRLIGLPRLRPEA